MIKTALSQTQEENSLQLTRNYQVVSIRRNNRMKHFQKKRIRSGLIDEVNLPTMFIDPQYQTHSAYSQAYTSDQLYELIENCCSQDMAICLRSAVGLRKLVSLDHSIAKRLIQERGIKEIVGLARMQHNPQIMLQATWCLANIASFQGINWAVFRESKGLDVLMSILQRSSQFNILIYEHTVITLSNIAADSQQLRNEMVERDCIYYMVSTIMNSTELPSTTLQNTCWAFSNIIRAHNPPPYCKVQPAVKYICCVISQGCQNFTDQTIITDCIFVLAHNININIGNLQEMNQMKFLPFIIKKCFNNPCRSQLIACLRVLGNYSTGSHELTQQMLEYGLIQALLHTLHHQNQRIRSQTCWVLSNIAANPQETAINLISNSQLLSKLASLLAADTLNVRKEVCFIFANLTFSINPESYFKLITAVDFAENVSELLDCEDEKVLKGVLHSLAIVLSFMQQDYQRLGIFVKHLQRSQGLVRLQRLQSSKNEQITKAVNNILQKYVEKDEHVDVNSNDWHVSFGGLFNQNNFNGQNRSTQNNFNSQTRV